MKRFLIIISILLTSKVFCQSPYDLIPSKFYTKIDPQKKLQCCDSCSSGIKIIHKIPLHELPIYDKLDINQYENEVMDESLADLVVSDLFQSYTKLSPDIKEKINKTCYKIKEIYKVEHDKTGSGIYWVEGTLIVTFTFQSNEKDFGLPWWKKLYYKVIL